jgi:uncharacterized membrane protein YfcA
VLDAAAVAMAAVLCSLVAFVYSNLGLGGGILYVPILLSLGIGGGAEANLIVVPISLTLTVATATAAILTHRRRGLVDLASAKVLLPGAFLGTLAGTAVNVLLLNRPAFLLFFTAVLVLFGALMAWEKFRNGGEEGGDDETRYTARRKLAASAASVGSGFFSGASGVGGGLVNVPILNVLLGRRTRKAVGTSSLVIVPVATLGFALTLALNTSRNLPLLREDFLLIPLLFPIVFLGGYAGSTLGLNRLRTRTVTAIFIALIFLTAAKMVLVDLLGLP